MTISKKLMIIVVLTVVEVTFTIWAAMKITNGATFHQLNSLHLKYNAQFSGQVTLLERGRSVAADELRETLELIRQQPVDCLAMTSSMDRLVMSLIGTDYALGLCEKDIRDADDAIFAVEQFRDGLVSRDSLTVALVEARDVFNSNSAAFEAPITKTVQFLLHTLIPMIILISVFNISFITYLSKTISGSIRRAIDMLSSNDSQAPLSEAIGKSISGELRNLLTVAQKRIEEDFLRIETNEKLRDLIAEKTRSLQASNDELERLAHRTSHAIGTPLGIQRQLCNEAQSSLNQGDTEQAAIHLSKLRSNISDLEMLIRDLGALAAAESGDVASSRFKVQSLVDEVAEALASQIAAARISIQVENKGADSIICERRRLRDVLTELVSNSCKYHDPASDERWVRLRFAAGSEEYFVTVEDNGLGIPAKHRSEIFSESVRCHADIAPGSGLGLAIAKKHIERMGGKIELRPANHGARFVIALPRDDSADQRSAA